DGIRDFHVTGVQTCALPISDRGRPTTAVRTRGAHRRTRRGARPLRRPGDADDRTEHAQRCARLMAETTARRDDVTIDGSMPTPQYTLSPMPHSMYEAARESSPGDRVCSL